MFVVSVEFQLVITNTYHYRPITHRMLHFRKHGGWIELGVPWDHGIPKPKVHRCFVWMHLLGHRAQLRTLSHNQKHNQTRSCKFLRPDPGPLLQNIYSLWVGDGEMYSIAEIGKLLAWVQILLLLVERDLGSNILYELNEFLFPIAGHVFHN